MIKPHSAFITRTHRTSARRGKAARPPIRPLWLSIAVWLCLLGLAAGCSPRAGTDAAAAGLPTGAGTPAAETQGQSLPTATLAQASPSPTPQPPPATHSPLSAAASTATPTSIPPSLTEAPPAPALLECRPESLEGTASDLCYLEGQLSLSRPIGPDGRNTVDVTYRYGSTQSGQRDPHNGVEFLNSYGTPVLAAADGVVVTAENDYDKVLGLYYNFYGNLVVVEHQLPGHSQPVYTLYGHLAEFNVSPGEAVKAGQQIGLVGMGGAATGSHLHFEVRYGENDYQASRNPEIWLAPLIDETGRPMGALAGRILDAEGNSLESENIVLERLSPDGYTIVSTYVLTYHEKWMSGQLPWEDTFGIGDLPAGSYRVSFVQRGMQHFLIEIKPGQLAVVTFRV